MSKASSKSKEATSLRMASCSKQALSSRVEYGKVKLSRVKVSRAKPSFRRRATVNPAICRRVRTMGSLNLKVRTMDSLNLRDNIRTTVHPRRPMVNSRIVLHLKDMSKVKVPSLKTPNQSHNQRHRSSRP